MQWRWSLPNSGTNGKQWRSVIEGTSTFFKRWPSMWHLYSWTSVTEMAKWSTTGFSLQCQSLVNQTNQHENHNNNQLEDTVLMYHQILRTVMWREMKDSEGELQMKKIWRLFKYIIILIYNAIKKLKFKLASRTMSSQILLALGKFWFTYFEFLNISWRMTSLGPCPLGKWQWIYLSWTTGEIFLSPGL